MKLIKNILICVSLFTIVMLLSHLIMGDITHQFRWDLNIAYCFGAIHAIITYKE